MNRAYLIILVPAILAAIAYFGVAAHRGAHLNLAPFVGAGGGFLAAICLVWLYRRRRARRPST